MWSPAGEPAEPRGRAAIGADMRRAPPVSEALSWQLTRADQPPVAIVLLVAPLAAFQTDWVFEPNFGPCMAVMPL